MSTPLESNTEGLQEILNTVYNLPDRSTGGSSEPDLVIGINVNNELGAASDWFYLLGDNIALESFVILGGSVSTVIEKIKNGITPWVQLREMQVYNNNCFSRGICDAVYVSTRNTADIGYKDDSGQYNKDLEQYDSVYAMFHLLKLPCYDGGTVPHDLTLQVGTTGVAYYWANRYTTQ